MKKRIIGLTLSAAVAMLSFAAFTGCAKNDSGSLIAEYTFDEASGRVAHETVSDKDHKINYVFDEDNADVLLKEPSEPLRRTGVKGNALYMDGFSVGITNDEFTAPRNAITLSAWVAPRVFENLSDYGGDAEGHPRLTAVVGKGNIEICEGFLMGYGRLGMWGVQLGLHSTETDEDFVVGFYDPINVLPLYEWSHISVSYDGSTGYIGLFFNGKTAYESIIPELAATRIVKSEEPLTVGHYTSPLIEYGIERQYMAGLLDEVKIYGESLSPAKVKDIYNDRTDENHPSLEWKDVGIDSSVYAGDRYRPQYHALPPGCWMNEPHSPFYYNGKYHVMYQHNPAGPYWMQIRWGHLVSDDMIHWEYVKDSVVPTAGICPEGVWTGGACIGPDGLPWLVITAGTNTTSWSDQNIAYAHPKDPTDPYLTEWVVESTVVVGQPDDVMHGERGQFRDPFVWKDGDNYYMIVSSSVPGAGGTAIAYTSTDMREWTNMGYLYTCDLDKYPEQGIHWECVIMLPVSNGTQTKYVLFDCPQYASSETTVECYYWLGTFDKITCKFIADDDKPKLFDMGRGIFTGQNGYCYLTDEDKAAGKTEYEQGRSIVYAIAQGKDATGQNFNSGWAHNFAMPIELKLSDDGTEIVRAPIKELESVRTEKLYGFDNGVKTASELNSEISDLRGDLLEIRATFTLDPANAENYSGGISVRYNPNTVNGDTERTDITFGNSGVYIEKAQSTLLTYISKTPTHTWERVEREYSVTILLDRSMLEVYVNGVMSFTTRIYPKYGDSDHLHIFDNGSGIKFTSFDVYRMGSAYSDTVTPPYYGNVGNLGD